MINTKKMMDRALFALSVPKCVCCGERLEYGQKALCSNCCSSLEEHSMRTCSRCAKKLNECDCANRFLESHFIKQVIKCYRYDIQDKNTPANALIYSLKRDNRRDVLDKASDLLLEAIHNSIGDIGDYVITNIPRRKDAIVEHGIDHSALLAHNIAIKAGAEYISLLKSNSTREQKSLDHLSRRKNADFSLTKDISLSGRKVIIVDDIITSGASMSNAATLVRSLGSKDIIAACLAIAYKED